MTEVTKQARGLPPGQRETATFPRFGLPDYARRAPDSRVALQLALADGRGRSSQLDREALGPLQRIEQASDFHCVTTWSTRGLRWGGFRFRDFYEQILVPAIQPDASAQFVVFRCLDGYSVTMLREDALQPDVLLADMLEGRPLSAEHGAPMRVVAPRHYGYKNAKHLRAIELRHDYHGPRSVLRRFVDHPRARVALEERGRGVPGWILRYLYRPLIGRTTREFDEGLRTPSR